MKAYLRFLSRGDAVKVVGSDGDTATLLLDGQLCAVPSFLLRAPGEKEYPLWEGYCRSGAGIFADRTMTGRAESPAVNTPVKVLESFDKYYYVQWEKGFGFMTGADISYVPLVASYGGDAPAPSDSSSWTEPVK